MNKEALYSLSYGMYIICAKHNGKVNGQVANVGGQMTDNPPRVGICLNKDNLTCQMVKDSGVFTLSILSEDTDMKLIGKFGYKSGSDIDKFENTDYFDGPVTGVPVVRDSALSYMEVKVENFMEMDNYIYFVGKVVNSDILAKGKPMTYAYYHEIKGGLSPKNAPTYVAPEANKTNKKEEKKMKKYKCEICGYVYDPEKGDPDNGVAAGTSFEDVPENWTCPLCGVGKDQFSVDE